MSSKTTDLGWVIGTCLIFGLFCPSAAGNHPLQENKLLDQSVIAAESSRINCYESAKYLVVTQETPGKAGSDILIKYKSKASQKFPCLYVRESGDFEIHNEWAEYFAGLKKDLLILDSTTGPGPSGLMIWDLKSRKKVYEGSWSDPEESTNDSLVFWTETDEASDVNCPEFRKWKSYGLEAAIETKAILNLSNFTMTKTKEKRCSPRQ